MKSLLLMVLLLISFSAEAKLCKWIDTDGRMNFSFDKNKPTKTLSGTVTALAFCPEPAPVKVTKVEYDVYTLPNPQNDCEKTAVHACDPEYGGMKLYTNPNIVNGIIEQQCIGLTIKAGTPPDSYNVYYAYPEIYSGIRQRPDGTQYCIFD